MGTPRLSRSPLISLVGIGSSKQLDDLEDVTNLVNFSGLIESNATKISLFLTLSWALESSNNFTFSNTHFVSTFLYNSTTMVTFADCSIIFSSPCLSFVAALSLVPFRQWMPRGVQKQIQSQSSDTGAIFSIFFCVNLNHDVCIILEVHG